MIILHEDKKYYILIDKQGGDFAGGCIFEGLDEIIERARAWADNDDYTNPTLKGWTISDILENWTFDCKAYDGKDWVELSEEELNYTK